MNNFWLSGQVLRIEHHAGDRNGSLIFVQYLSIKAQKENRNSIAQISKVIELRVPQQRRENLESIAVGDFIEIGGRIQGIVRHAAENTHLNNELVAERFQKAVLLNVNDENPFSGVDKGFLLTGIVRRYEAARSEKAYGKVFIQYGPTRESQMRPHEFTNTLAIKIPPKVFAAERLQEGKGISVSGYPQAALFRVPGTDHEITETELIAARLKPTEIVNATLSPLATATA